MLIAASSQLVCAASSTCGYSRDCPRSYSLAAINASASLWDLSLPLSLPKADWVLSLEVTGAVTHISWSRASRALHPNRLDHTSPSHLTVKCVPSQVGEHLPAALEPAYIRNLVAHARKGLITSWANLGQPGYGHINNHSPEYLVSLFGELGFRRSELLPVCQCIV